MPRSAETPEASPQLDSAEPSSRAGLRGFLAGVHERVRTAVADPRFHPHHRELLAATVGRASAASDKAPFGSPLSVMYLVARAHGRPDAELTERIGAFCLLYILSLDLFDDVQDDDLAGKPHANVGAAIAVNSAITLSFLANAELHAVLPRLPDDDQRQALLAIADEAGLAAVAGQHLDLMGNESVTTPEEVLAMQQGKTSSVILFAACGALLGGAGANLRARYRRVGERLAQLVQVRDDLRDIFGKWLSPDLATGKLTYPLACFFEDASTTERARFDELVQELPGSMKSIRALLYEAGAVRRSAQTLESCRRAIHHELVAIEAITPAYHRLLLDVVDELAGGVYPVPELAPSAALRRPGTGLLATRVARELERLVRRLSPLGLPADLPTLQPWHQAHWMYMPAKHTIFFPDLDELGDEILPFHALLLGSSDLDEPRRLLTAQVPLVLAHELFHFWRHAAGRLTTDHWHEEWAANQLSVAYALAHEPRALETAIALAERVVGRFPAALGDEAQRLLEDCQQARANTNGYGAGVVEVAVVTLEMVRRLAGRQPSLVDSVAELLTPTELARSA